MIYLDGTVTIPLYRYNDFISFEKDEALIAKLKEDIYDFERHNKALQERINDFNKKSWYQRVFKSKV